MNETGIIALQDESQIAGAIVWWDLYGNTDIDDVRDALNHAEFAKSWEPVAPRLETVSGRAAKAAITSKRQLCRPLSKRGDCEFVTEEIVIDDGEETLKYQPRVRITMYEEDKQRRINVAPITPEDVALAKRIGRNVQLYRNLLTATDISNWLLGILTHKIKAVRLRDRGGFYFVPAGEALEKWKRICTVVHDVSDHKMCTISAMRVEETVEVILDAMRREATQEMQKHEEYLAGETSTRGLNSAEKHISALQQKIAHYAELLGVALPELVTHATQLLGGVQAARILKTKPVEAA